MSVKEELLPSSKWSKAIQAVTKAMLPDFQFTNDPLVRRANGSRERMAEQHCPPSPRFSRSVAIGGFYYCWGPSGAML